MSAKRGATQKLRMRCTSENVCKIWPTLSLLSLSSTVARDSYETSARTIRDISSCKKNSVNKPLRHLNRSRTTSIVLSLSAVNVAGSWPALKHGTRQERFDVHGRPITYTWHRSHLPLDHPTSWHWNCHRLQQTVCPVPRRCSLSSVRIDNNAWFYPRHADLTILADVSLVPFK
jgi:hypothetical protein